MAARLVLLALCIISAVGAIRNDAVKVCYYDRAAEVRKGPGLLKPEDIDPTLCTHVVYCFAKVTQAGKIHVFKEGTKEKENLKFIKTLKEKNPKVKVLLGIAAYIPKFLRMTETNMEKFIKNLKKFLTEKKFDGVDFFMHSIRHSHDWRLSTCLPLQLQLFKEVKQLLPEDLVTATYHPSTLLNITSPRARKMVVDIIRELDLLNLATYDLHTYMMGTLGHHTSLDAIITVIDEMKTLFNLSSRSDIEECSIHGNCSNGLCVNTAGSFKCVCNKGYVLTADEKSCQDVGFHKITLGLATYGRTYKMVSPDQHMVGNISNGPGPRGPYTKMEGFLSTYEICSKLQEPTIHIEGTIGSPYAYDNVTWICYDDNQSLLKKLYLVESNNFAGVSVWSIDLCDFKNECHYKPHFPEEKKLITIQSISKALAKAFSNVSEISQAILRPARPLHKGTGYLKYPWQHHFSPKVRACYYNSKAAKRPGEGKFTMDLIPPQLCSHLFYAFVYVDKLTGRLLDPPEEDIRMLKVLKWKNPQLKVIISVVGYNEKTLLKQKIPEMARELVDWTLRNEMDGADIYQRRYELQSASDPFMTTFSDFLETVHNVLGERRGEFLLITTLNMKGQMKPVADCLKRLEPFVDWFHLAMYDFVTYRDLKVGSHAPLNEIKEKINFFLSSGISPVKMVMGLAAYGRTFELADKKKVAVGSKAVGPGPKGDFTNTPGSLAMYEICMRKYKILQDTNAEMPYGYQGYEWISFDDDISLGLKLDFVLDNHLRGVYLWAVDRDDIINRCGHGKFDFLEIINNKMHAFKLKKVAIGSVVNDDEDVVPRLEGKICRSVGIWEMMPWSNWWCSSFCAFGMCNSAFCTCY